MGSDVLPRVGGFRGVPSSGLAGRAPGQAPHCFAGCGHLDGMWEAPQLRQLVSKQGTAREEPGASASIPSPARLRGQGASSPAAAYPSSLREAPSALLQDGSFPIFTFLQRVPYRVVAATRIPQEAGPLGAAGICPQRGRGWGQGWAEGDAELR